MPAQVIQLVAEAAAVGVLPLRAALPVPLVPQLHPGVNLRRRFANGRAHRVMRLEIVGESPARLGRLMKRPSRRAGVAKITSERV